MASQPLLDVPPAAATRLVRKWLVRTLATYPEQTSRFLASQADPFHNPVGRAFREGLPALFEQLRTGFDRKRMTPVLAEIVRIRAVQDFTPGEALRFIFLLKEILREEEGLDPGEVAELEARIDDLALLGFDLYAGCRRRISEIKLREAERMVFLPARRRQQGEL